MKFDGYLEWKRCLPTLGQAMTRKLGSITRKSAGTYSVELEVVGADQRLTFNFVVDSRDDIDVIVSSEEFTHYIAHNSGPYTPLLEAVLRFHLAQTIEFP